MNKHKLSFSQKQNIKEKKEMNKILKTDKEKQKAKNIHYKKLWNNQYRDFFNENFKILTDVAVDKFIKENEGYKNNAQFYIKLRIACTQRVENHLKTYLANDDDGRDRIRAYYSYFLDEELVDYMFSREVIVRNALFGK